MMFIEAATPDESEHEDSETVLPQNDYLFIKPLLNHEEKSRGGIIMPTVEDPTHNVRTEGRFIVVAVGEGPWTDVPGPNGALLRRPMPCKPGDVIYFQGTAFQGRINGETVGIIQAYQVICVIKPKKDPAAPMLQ